MKNSDILKMGIMGIIFITVLISGCTSSSTAKTFSDGVISFNYPNDYDNISYSTKTNTSSSPMQRICKFENIYTITIMPGKNITATSPYELMNRSISKNKNVSNSEIVSVTNETNPNGIVVEKITYKQPDSKFGIMIRYDDMYFKTKGEVYAISVYGPDFFNEQITGTTKIIFQSIK